MNTVHCTATVFDFSDFFNLKLDTFVHRKEEEYPTNIVRSWMFPNQQSRNFYILQQPQSIIPHVSSSHSDHAAPRLVAPGHLGLTHHPVLQSLEQRLSAAAGGRTGSFARRELFPDPDPQPWRCPSPAPPSREVSPLANCKVRPRPSC